MDESCQRNLWHRGQPLSVLHEKMRVLCDGWPKLPVFGHAVSALFNCTTIVICINRARDYAEEQFRSGERGWARKLFLLNYHDCRFEWMCPVSTWRHLLEESISSKEPINAFNLTTEEVLKRISLWKNKPRVGLDCFPEPEGFEFPPELTSTNDLLIQQLRQSTPFKCTPVPGSVDLSVESRFSIPKDFDTYRPLLVNFCKDGIVSDLSEALAEDIFVLCTGFCTRNGMPSLPTSHTLGAYIRLALDEAGAEKRLVAKPCGSQRVTKWNIGINHLKRLLRRDGER